MIDLNRENIFITRIISSLIDFVCKMLIQKLISCISFEVC